MHILILAAALAASTPNCAPPVPITHNHGMWCAAATAWGESSGEGREGMAMVVQVLLGDQQHYGHDACAAAAAPGRFHAFKPQMKPWTIDPSTWCTAVDVASLVYAQQYPFQDPVCAAAAEYFHSGARPGDWRELTHLCTVGNHHFYRR